MSLGEEVEEKFPNTKVIPYPYKHVDEQETLTLLDDVLNSWGRYGNAQMKSRNMLTLVV
jgi:hypothetical protein